MREHEAGQRVEQPEGAKNAPHGTGDRDLRKHGGGEARPKHQAPAEHRQPRQRVTGWRGDEQGDDRRRSGDQDAVRHVAREAVVNDRRAIRRKRPRRPETRRHRGDLDRALQRSGHEPDIGGQADDETRAHPEPKQRPPIAACAHRFIPASPDHRSDPTTRT